ncbi:hypothetical protein O3M35_002808 [Rhynocoris fuscipes]|uniref:Uncharacterized protein n=1 Tax=Rhynocoris fuscipes TaxID=488301 RepID=A0AAW1CMR7_9HEMI
MPEANTLLKDEKFYKKLDLFINSIHNDVVRLDIERKKYCVKVTQGIVETLIKRLKEESLVFELFFQKISYVGSYFDGLRVSDATEFDLNFVLNLQFNYDKIKIENSADFPGHVLLNVRNVVLDEKKFTASILKEWKKWVDPDGYLLHDAVLRWWESIHAKISDKGRYPINYDGKFYEVRSYKNGPALTLKISNTGDNLEIDVDLVPVLEFPSSRSPPAPTRWVSSGVPKKFLDDTCWAVVPKPMDDKRLWRLSFTAQEQKVMLDLRHLKYINKLLKKFRDANKLNIPSYQIKTFFIWEAFEKKKAGNEDFWKKPPSYLLAYMLVKLAEALEKKELPFFWNPNMNLFNFMIKKSPALLPNMEGQVKKIIVNLNKLIESSDTAELEKKLCILFGVEQRNGILKNSIEEHNGPITNLESSVPEDSVKSNPGFVQNESFLWKAIEYSMKLLHLKCFL